MKPPSLPSAAGLRRQAEVRLKKDPAAKRARALPGGTPRELHELQVHRIQLEMQNEELRNSRALIEAGLARFTDLYDFAPVGYFTLSRDGVITRTNLTGARLLGLERAHLPGKRFLVFVAEPDRTAFAGFLRNVFASGPDSSCEVALPRPGRPPLTVHIEALLSATGDECRAMAMDVTDRKEVDAENRRLYGELEQRVRVRTATIRRLATELTLAEQRERSRLSHVLHEDLQQLIVGAIYILQTASLKMSPPQRKEIARVKHILANTIQVARTLAVELSPPILKDESLAAVLRWLAGWMKENHGLTVKVIVGAPDLAVPAELTVILYQAVRELLFNVVKHARIKAATVSLDCIAGQVRIVVKDRGAGFAMGHGETLSASPDKFGLFSVRERLSLLNGHVEISSSPHEGTRITLRAPLRPVT